MEVVLTDLILPAVGTVVTALIGFLSTVAVSFLKSHMSKANAEEMESNMRQLESVMIDAVDTVEDELRVKLEKTDFTTDSESINKVSKFVNENAPIVMKKLGVTREYIDKKAEAWTKQLIRDLRNEKLKEAEKKGTSEGKQ